MAELLDVLLHRLFPSLVFRCIAHEDKQDLEKSIVKKLRGWQRPGVRFVVMRDQDSADCHAVKARLKMRCEQGHPLPQRGWGRGRLVPSVYVWRRALHRLARKSACP